MRVTTLFAIVALAACSSDPTDPTRVDDVETPVASWGQVLSDTGNNFGLNVMELDVGADALCMVGLATNQLEFEDGTLVTANGQTDGFFARMSLDGHEPRAALFGGKAFDMLADLDVGADGEIVVAGSFRSNSRFGTHELVSAGLQDAVVARVDRRGDVEWVQTLTGPEDQSATGVTLLPGGDVVVAGSYMGPSTVGRTTLADDGFVNLFVVAFDSEGQPRWLQNAICSEILEPSAICSDANGNVYVAGSFSGTAGFAAEELSSVASFDGFVAAFSSTGAPLWVHQMRSLGMVRVEAMEYVDPDFLIVAGRATGPTSLGPYAQLETGQGFVFSLGTDGSPFGAVGLGDAETYVNDVVVLPDRQGIWVTGAFTGSMRLTPNSELLESAGLSDAFVGLIDTRGEARMCWQIGGPLREAGSSIDLDAEGNVYAAGTFTGQVELFGSEYVTPLGNRGVYLFRKLQTEIEDLAPVAIDCPTCPPISYETIATTMELRSTSPVATPSN